jgi:hypothetical protein
MCIVRNERPTYYIVKLCIYFLNRVIKELSRKSPMLAKDNVERSTWHGGDSSDKFHPEQNILQFILALKKGGQILTNCS